jgi:hypothetical protein
MTSPWRVLPLALPVALTVLPGCGLISFDIERDLPEQRVNGSIVSMLLDGLIDNPIPMEIDLEQEIAARDAGVACGATLTSLTFSITPSSIGAADQDDFDFVEGITIHVESSRSSTSLPRRTLADLDPVPRGATTLALNPSGVDLLPYIEEGAVITSAARGSSPPDDVTFDGRYVVEVEAL